jgi:hypothetical protein
MKVILFCVGLFLFILPFWARDLAWSQIPQTISYQGILTDAEGNPRDGNFTLTFKLYEAPEGGSPVWQETQQVVVANGLFNVMLGKNNPLQLPFDTTYWLGITVDAGPELQPRIQLTSAAYSLNARSIADTTVSTAKLQDGAVTAAKIASGQVVKSINNLKDDVTLVAGSNVAITPSGDTLTISASPGGGDGHSLDAADGDPVDAIYVDDKGNVGIGTTNPKSLFHVSNNTDSAEMRITGQDNTAGKGPVLSLMEYHPSQDYGFKFWLDGSQNQLYVEGIANGVSKGKHLTINRDNGNIGIGTTSPEAKLHVAGGDIVLGDDKIQNTNGRSVYLAGHVFLTPWGTGDVAYLQARRGDNSGDTELQFRTSFIGNVVEAMRITSLGEVGIGTTAPKATLHVKGRQIWIDGANGASPSVVWAEDGHEKWYITTTGIHSDLEINKFGGGAALRLAYNTGNLGIGKTSPQYKLDVAGSVAGQGPYINLSDRRLKKNIHTLSHALDKVMQLRGVDFEWRRDEYPDMNLSEGKQIGFVAQEIQQVLPEVVKESGDGEYSVAYGQVVPVLVEAIKEQQKIIEELRTRIQRMESSLQNLQPQSVQTRNN